MSPRPWHWGVGTIVLAATLLSAPQAAQADAAGPTDFRSEVLSVTPATDAITVSIEGGDAFVHVVVEPGHEVIVPGYDDEPYLRISGDGTVEENLRSMATYYNAERYGTDEIPDIVDNTATPQWRKIGDGGSWAWHDHRAHWMGSDPPIGLDAGESLPPQVIALIVDGDRVEVEVATTLQPNPSLWPAVFGVLIGLQLVLLAALAGPATVTLATLVLSSAATVAGVVQFRSLPAETGPLLSWWLLPSIALACTIGTILIYGRWPLLQSALAMLAGLQLALWAYTRRGTVTRAVLPTDLPFWLDRMITAAALVGGVAIVVVSLLTLFRPAPVATDPV